MRRQDAGDCCAFRRTTSNSKHVVTVVLTVRDGQPSVLVINSGCDSGHEGERRRATTAELG